MNGWMDDGWMDRWVDGWMDEWMDGLMDGQMGGWMDRWMDGLRAGGIIDSSLLDRNDPVQIAWSTDEVISLHEYLNHCIAVNWIDVDKLKMEQQYADSAEIYDKICGYVFDALDDDTKILTSLNILTTFFGFFGLFPVKAAIYASVCSTLPASTQAPPHPHKSPCAEPCPATRYPTLPA